MIRTMIGIGIVTAACIATAAPHEMTPEGQWIERAPATAVPRGETGLPFADQPDWRNTLRLQVGGLAIGDLDGDGRNDLAVGTYRSSSFPPYDDWHDYVYFNGEEGLEATPSWQSQEMRHTSKLAIADIDGDGRNDLVAVRGGSGYDPDVVFYNSAEGLATAPGWQSQAPAWGVGMALVDIDGDGDLDLVTANQGNGSADPHRPLYLYRNTGSGFDPVPAWQSAQAAIQNSVAAGDLDGDGLPDLAVAKWVNFESAAYLNVDGTPAPAPFWTTGSTAGDRGVAIADFDGDGLADILIGQDVLRLYRNDGKGGFEPVWQSGNTQSNHQGLAVADVDGDGFPDIAEIDFARGKVWLTMNRGGQLDADPVWAHDGEGSGTALAFGDLDGDGMPDLVVGFSGEPSVMVFLNRLAPPEPEPDDTIFANGFEAARLGDEAPFAR